MQQKPSPKVNQRQLDNYLRTHRKHAGLTQREVGNLLAYSDEGAVSRHEQSKSLPPLLIAIAYEVIFQKPIAELFPGMRETVRNTVEQRMLRFEEALEQHSRSGSRASRVAQKLAWLYERQSVRDE